MTIKDKLIKRRDELQSEADALSCTINKLDDLTVKHIESTIKKEMISKPQTVKPGSYTPMNSSQIEALKSNLAAKTSSD